MSILSRFRCTARKKWNAYDDESPENVYSASSLLNYLTEKSYSKDELQYSSIHESIIDNLTMEGVEIPYGYYYGGKPQGDGVLGLEMNLYEDSTFYIYSSFDLFNDDGGDEYYFSGTYKIDRINNNGKPVLLFLCNEGSFELTWDGDEFRNDSFFAWYDGE